MILTCPSCGTQYVVKDGAIPPPGRQVRCASCKHSWHQEAEVAEAVETSPEPEFTQEDENDVQGADSVQADALPDGSQEEDLSSDYAPQEPATVEHEPEPHEEGPRQEAAGWVAPDDEFAPFGPRGDVEERRGSNPAFKILLIIFLVAALAAAFWFLATPELKSRLGIAQSDESPLQLMLTHSQRQVLASGNILLAVTGRVINPTDEVQPVPPIQAELRKASGELVYSWTISPPASSIPPGGKAGFNSAEVNVPVDGDLLTITFDPSKA